MASRKPKADPMVPEDVDGDIVTATAVDHKDGSRAGQPKFATVFMDELPENDKKRGGVGRGPSYAYKDALDLIRDQGQGSWGSVATFQTATGAATALRNIRRGLKIVPDDIEKFEFQTRRQTDENGVRLSVLWARYTG